MVSRTACSAGFFVGAGLVPARVGPAKYEEGGDKPRPYDSKIPMDR
jgi:hypothetical protein